MTLRHHQIALIAAGACLLTGLAGTPAALATGASETRDLAVPVVDAPVAKARSIDDGCPLEEVPPAGFVDVDAASSHKSAVDCIVHWGVAKGSSTTNYDPTRTVTRAQMASFLARLIDESDVLLRIVLVEQFGDDDGNPHESNINRLAVAGVVGGTGAGRYNPDGVVTRAQMAAFLTRAYDYIAVKKGKPLLAEGPDYFVDDDASALSAEINKAAAAGFTGGYGDRIYGPALSVRRDHMASFLARVLDRLVDEAGVRVPSLEEEVPPPYAEPTQSLLELVSCGENGDYFEVKLRHTISGGSWQIPFYDPINHIAPERHWDGSPASEIITYSHYIPRGTYEAGFPHTYDAEWVPGFKIQAPDSGAVIYLKPFNAVTVDLQTCPAPVPAAPTA